MSAWIEWVSAGIAVASVAVAVAALMDSRKANRIAQQANEKADAANEIAAEANRFAAEGNEIAVEANRIAVDGNKLAEEANLTAREAALVAVERQHVLWNLAWQGEGGLQLANVGEDPAHDVIALVEVGDHQARGTQKVVPPGGGVTLHFGGLAEKCAEDVLEARRVQQRQKQNPMAGGCPYEFMWPLSLRIKWVSPLGKPGSYEAKERCSSSEILGL